MTPDQEAVSRQRSHTDTERDAVWRRRAKVYVFLHAVACLCMCVFGLEYVPGYRTIPAVIVALVGSVSMVGLLPFIVSSPIVSIMMISASWRRGREWLYLGICDLSLLILHIISTTVASQ